MPDKTLKDLFDEERMPYGERIGKEYANILSGALTPEIKQSQADFADFTKQFEGRPTIRQVEHRDNKIQALMDAFVGKKKADADHALAITDRYGSPGASTLPDGLAPGSADMITPDGRPTKVHPSDVPNLLGQGYTLPPEGTTTDVGANTGADRGATPALTGTYHDVPATGVMEGVLGQDVNVGDIVQTAGGDYVIVEDDDDPRGYSGKPIGER